MKLLRKTLGLYLMVSIPIFLASMGGFYFFIKYVITRQVDNALLQDKQKITDFVNHNKNDVTELYKNISSGYYLLEIAPDSIVPDKKGFISVYDSTYHEFKPIRELRSSLTIQGKNYEIVLHQSFVESDSLIYSIASFALFLFIVLSLGISIVQVFVSRTIWAPFKNTLRKISKFKPGTLEIEDFNKTPIEEFSLLNAALNKMVLRINSDFERQKKFIDHISHELQTPVSVMGAQIELLIQEMELKESSAAIIGVIEDTLVKMRKINHALLLLSRIENNQFAQTQEVDISEIVTKYLESNKEQIHFKQIKVDLKINAPIKVNMNHSLAEVLIGNLLANAVLHNTVPGEIDIGISKGKFEINNTGMHLDVEPETLFNKFIQYSGSAKSSGIGLSLVKEICNYYGFHITYQINENRHIIKVGFNALDSL
jgi:two-component system, OmpR family, sensor kinase